MDLVARLSLKDDFSARMKKVTSVLTRTKQATDTYRDSLGRLRDSNGRFIKENETLFTRMKNSFKGARKSLSDVSGGFFDVGRSSSSARSSVNSFKTSLMSIASAIGLTAAIAGGFNMIKSSVRSAMARIDVMESFERVLTELTGSVEKTKEALDKTREAVTGTAYGLDVAAKSVQNFVTRGMEIGKATETMAAWGDAVAFYGNGSNEQLETVMDALAKMYSSGKVAMDQMNRLYDAGIDGVGMYAKAVGRDVNVVQKELSKGKIPASQFIDVVTKAMMEGTNGVTKIAGAAKEAGASWGASFDNMRAAVTRGVTDIIQTIDKMLVDNGLPDMRAMIAEFGRTFERNLKKAATFIAPLVTQLKRIYNAIKPIMPALKELAIAVGIAVAAVAGFFAVVSAFKAIGAAIMFLTSPIGLAIGAITGLVLIFRNLYKTSEPFRAFIDKIVGGVKGLFKIMSGDKAGGLGAMLEAGMNTEAIRKVFAFADGIKNGFSTVKNFVMSFVDNIKPRVAEFVTYLAQKWQDLQPGIATLLSAFSTAKETAVNIFTTLWSALQPVFGALGIAFRIIADVAVAVFNNLIAPAVKFVWGAFQTLWKVVGPILKLVGEAIGIAFEVLSIVWENIVKPFASFMKDQFVSALDAVTPVLDAISGAFEWLGEKVETVAGWFSGFRDMLSNFKVPSWLSRLGGGGTVKFESNEGDGGGKGGKSKYHGIDYVPYDGYQISAHKGEAVITAAENKERKKGGLTGGISISGNTFHVRQESDIDAIAEALYVKINGAAEAGA
ncbi:tape measure protein [Sporosarcina sp. SAFN-015]|uniref:tape measure protein n=1 Tax=Sporosarcina sp. SAFN-015 TaxID=3387274 RepID=UPI003F7F1D37